jgi:hypothetical protein
MSWVRIDDNFADHPKLLRAGPVAGWLHVAGLCYAARQKTGGLVPMQVVNTLAVFNGVGMTRDGQLLSEPMGIDVLELARILTRAGLWEEQREGPTKVLTGWQIHDYAEYNPPKPTSSDGTIGDKIAGGQARAKAAKRDGRGRFVNGRRDQHGDQRNDQHGDQQ